VLIADFLKKESINGAHLAPEAWSKNAIKKKIFKFLLSKSNLIIVNSQEFKRNFADFFNLKATKIYNPILKENNFKNKKHKLTNSFFKKNTINLINIGRLVKQKNQIELIYALSKINNPDKFRLIIFGTGPEKKNLLKMIKKKKLDQFIKISSKQNEKLFYLKKSDIFILSSLFEGLPNVLLEAAINKKYIISSDCPTGPKEIIKFYKYGELYKTKKTDDLVNILNKFSSNKTLIVKLKRNINLKNIMFDYKHNLNLYYSNILKLSNNL